MSFEGQQYLSVKKILMELLIFFRKTSMEKPLKSPQTLHTLDLKVN